MKLRYITALILLCSGLLTGCGGTASQLPALANQTHADHAMRTIRLGYSPELIFAPLFVGIERGYFADEGLSIALTPIQGGSASVVQLAAGNFDVAVGGAGAGLFNAAARGVKFKIVAPLHGDRPPLTSALVISAKRTDIKTIADLRGKTVAINAAGAATEYGLAQALAQGQLAIDDVNVTSVPFPDMPAALENGSLDGAILSEPYITASKQRRLITVLSDDYFAHFTPTYLYMGEPLLSQNPDDARGFLRAYLRACRDLQGDYMTPEIAKTIEKYTQVPAEITMSSALAEYDPQGRIPIEDLKTLQSYFMQRGVLQYTQPLDINSLVDTQLAAEVASALDVERR